MAPRPKAAARELVLGTTRQLLLQAAAEEFAREGYVGANINRILQAAGFAKGTIYNHFASKRALMLDLIDEAGAAHVDFVVEQVRQEEDPIRRLVRFFEAGFAYVASHLSQGLALITTLYGPDAEFKGRMFQAYQPLFDLLGQEVIAPGIARGLFRPVDPERTAGLLMTVYLGTGSQVGPDGRLWLDAGQVADFALRALRRDCQGLDMA